MTKFLFFISLIFISNQVLKAQEEPVKKIKIEKEYAYVKAAFNEADYKVVAFDKFGNPHQDAIKSFVIQYIEDKKVYQSAVEGNVFPEKTIKFLTKKKKYATKICLIKIVAQDKEEHLQSLPDLCDIVIFPDCKKK